MRMQTPILAALAAMVLQTPGGAQPGSPTHSDEDYLPISRPPRPIPPKLPSDEALALGRRIVQAVDGKTIAKRSAELVALGRVGERRQNPVASYPNGPIRAVPPIDLTDYPAWGFVIQQRVIDHAALHYAQRHSLDELKTMAMFFETPIGRKLAEERLSQSGELEKALSTKQLEYDLWNVICGRPVPQELDDAPHHAFHRLHPPVDFPLPPRPSYCS
jgi:hypothetical protein